MRSRESNCCPPPSTSRINSRIRWRSRSPFNSHRKAASPKPANVLHLRYRHRKSAMPRVVMITDERAKSFGGNFTHSHVRRRRHDRRSTRIETRHRQCATRPKGNRPNSAQRDYFFQIPEHPMLPQQHPVSSNSASYVLSVSCLFLCGPLRRISVNARFYVQCCLVL